MASGRIKRRQLARRLDALPRADDTDPFCPLCGRPIPPAQQDAHHMVPKSQGGRATTLLHRICHRQLHALFSEQELAREYASPEALLAHEEVRRFVEWVRTKPPDFHERARRSARRR